jgi:hypothetical protein
MDRRMDEHGGGLHWMASGEHLAICIDHDDIGGLDFAPEQPTGIEQKTPRAIAQIQTEMVAHALSKPMVGSSPQGQRQIGTQAGHGVGVEIGLISGPSQICHRFILKSSAPS